MHPDKNKYIYFMLYQKLGTTYFSMVENPMLSGSIRMEGMQNFTSKIRSFACKTTVMDGQGTLTKIQLSGF